MLSVGDKAPSFTLKNQNDENVSLMILKDQNFLFGFFQKLAQEDVQRKGVVFVIILKNFKKIISILLVLVKIL